MTSEHRRFSEHPEGSQANPSALQAYYGKSWAIVIGINDYAHAPLVNARHDAEAIAALLHDVHRFEEVHTLYDAEATGRAIMDWLRDDLRTRTTMDDRVIFFFAGHGTTLKINDRVAGGYLIPYDARVGRYADYIDMEELRRACGAIPAKHIFLILDCCFGGVAAVTARSTPPSLPAIHDDSFLQSVTRRRSWQVLTAGASDELVADSGLRPGHSAFTAALLDGLTGMAVRNQDGWLTGSELANYVRPRVVRETAGSSRRGQTPFFNYLAGSEEGDFVFRVPGTARPTPIVEAPAVPDTEEERTPRRIVSRAPPWAVAIAGVILMGLAGLGGMALSSFLQGNGGGDATPTMTSAAAGAAVSENTDGEIVSTDTFTSTVAPTPAPSTATPTAPPEPPAGETWTNTIDQAVYVYVPAGEFTMGSGAEDTLAGNDEMPQHEVYVDGFWIMQTEVTNAQYRNCVEAGACVAPSNNRWNDATYAEHPVTHVIWNQAQTYAEWVGGRLPTEAEWEKACRGTDERIYPWGTDWDKSERTPFNFCDANCASNWKDGEADDGYAETAPVGSYSDGASPYGALDMVGNVSEWTADWYANGYYANSPDRSPTGPDRGEKRTLRGGNYDYVVHGMRCASRASDFANKWAHNRGFRVVRLPIWR